MKYFKAFSEIRFYFVHTNTHMYIYIHVTAHTTNVLIYSNIELKDA